MRKKLTFRSRSRQGIGRFVGIVVVALISGGGTWFVLTMPSSAPPPPALLQALPSAGSDHASQVWFVDRLKERFPASSPESALIRELWLEGFLPTTDLRADHRAAEFDSSNKGGLRFCRLTAHVSWTADDKGQLTGIDGGYSGACS